MLQDLNKLLQEQKTVPMQNPKSKVGQKHSTQPGKSRKRITQNELEVIKSLRVLSDHHKELRNDVVERIENGAKIEPGDLVVEYTQKVSRSLSFDRLAEVVGEEEAIRIQSEISPAIHSYLKITRP